MLILSMVRLSDLFISCVRLRHWRWLSVMMVLLWHMMGIAFNMMMHVAYIKAGLVIILARVLRNVLVL